MADPCVQESRLIMMHTTLEELKTSNKELLRVLTIIAEQGAFIKSLQEKAIGLEKDTDGLFVRMRSVELKVERDGVKVGALVTGVSIFVSGVTAWVTALVVKSFK